MTEENLNLIMGAEDDEILLDMAIAQKSQISKLIESRKSPSGEHLTFDLIRECFNFVFIILIRDSLKKLYIYFWKKSTCWVLRIHYIKFCQNTTPIVSELILAPLF